MYKRGVSPLIATVLLVGFTVAIAGVFITWGSGFVKDIQSSTQQASKEKVTCSTDVGVKIKNACIEGSDVKLLLENFGSVDIIKFDVRTIGSLSASNVQTSSGLNAYDIQTFNVALDPSMGVLESVEVFPVVNLASEEVSCANNFDKRRGIENCVATTGCTFPEILCNSVCTTPFCFNDAQCGTGTCQNPGTCNAQCIGAGGDTINPTVSITSPTSGATVLPSQSVTATASDNVAVASVQFKLDGINLGVADTTPPSPYSVIWDTTTASNGQHTLTAVATDTSGNTATSTSVTVNVNNVQAQQYYLDFDGVNDYVNIGDPSSGNLDFGTSSFSYGLWVYVTQNVGPYDMPWWKGGSNSGAPGYDMEFGFGGWNAYIADGVNNPGCSFGTGTLNQWVFVMVVVNRATNQLQCYTNGILSGSSTGIGTFGSVSSTDPASIGAYGVAGGGYPIRGRIDDFSIWNKALTSVEIQNINNNGIAGSETGLVSYWKFDEGTGQTAGDSKGTNHGTLGSSIGTDTNDPTWTQGSH